MLNQVRTRSLTMLFETNTEFILDLNEIENSPNLKIENKLKKTNTLL